MGELVNLNRARKAKAAKEKAAKGDAARALALVAPGLRRQAKAQAAEAAARLDRHRLENAADDPAPGPQHSGKSAPPSAKP